MLQKLPGVVRLGCKGAVVRAGAALRILNEAVAAPRKRVNKLSVTLSVVAGVELKGLVDSRQHCYLGQTPQPSFHLAF